MELGTVSCPVGRHDNVDIALCSHSVVSAVSLVHTSVIANQHSLEVYAVIISMGVSIGHIIANCQQMRRERRDLFMQAAL